MNTRPHLICLDFESWIFSQKINKDNLSDKALLKLDNGYTPKTLEKTLNLLQKYHQKVTFFLIFKLEKLYPGLIKTILREGHEVGWHGFTHQPICDALSLEQELRESKPIIAKYKIKSFQAPNLIFFKDGYKQLKNYGFSCSSSTYGNPNYSYTIMKLREIPISTGKQANMAGVKSLIYPSNLSLTNVLKVGLPYGSSYFWSLLGKNFYDKKLAKASAEGRVENLFIHNWQVFPATSSSAKYQPDEKRKFWENPLYLPYKKSVRETFEFLLSRHSFQRLDEYAEKL